MTRAKTGALPVPSAATGGVSDEEGRQSDSQLGQPQAASELAPPGPGHSEGPGSVPA